MSKRVPRLTLGDRLALSREKAGISSQGMADILGMSRHSITGYEKDRHDPNLATIEKWANETGFSLEWILTGTIEEVGVADRAVDRRRERQPVREPEIDAGMSREELAYLVAQLLVGEPALKRVRTNAEYELGPLDDDVLVDITREPAVVRHLAPTG